MVALDHDAALIPLRRHVVFLVFAGREDAVERAGALDRPAFQTVGMMRVVDELVLVPRRLLHVARVREIEHARVARDARAPLEAELEIRVRLRRREVAAGDFAHLLDLLRQRQRALLDLPSGLEKIRIFQPAKTRRAFAVEQQLPPRRLLRGREHIGLIGKGGRGEREHGGEKSAA